MAASHFGGRYGYGGNPHYSSCGIGHLLNKHSPYHVCTYSPDHGYAPPAERPIWPHSAEYSRMFPAGWTGEGSVADPSFRHPMVYMPTDTTQLGYYYQHVPRWRSQPGMLAPVPNPVEFHNPDLGFDYRSGYHNAVVNGGQGCPPGSLSSDDHHSEGISVDSPPVEQSPAAAKPVSMHEGNAAKSDEPVKPQMVPPAEDASPMPPATPTQTKSPGPAPRPGAELGRSAASPQLIPVPAR